MYVCMYVLTHMYIYVLTYVYIFIGPGYDMVARHCLGTTLLMCFVRKSLCGVNVIYRGKCYLPLTSLCRVNVIYPYITVGVN